MDCFFSLQLNWLLWLVSILATPIIAALVAWIGYRQKDIAAQQRDIADQQRVIADNKLKLDLFDRRWKVYDETRKLLGTITSEGEVIWPKLTAFQIAISPARFLFDEEFYLYLDGISVRMIDYWHDREAFMAAGPETDRSEGGEKLRAHSTWIREQFKELDRRIAPYMTIRA